MRAKRTVLATLALAGCTAVLAAPAPASAEPICVAPDTPCVYGVQENVQGAYDYVTYTLAHPDSPCTPAVWFTVPICITHG